MKKYEYLLIFVITYLFNIIPGVVVVGVYKLIYKILLGMNCFALNKNTKAYQSVRFRFGYDNNKIDIRYNFI